MKLIRAGFIVGFAAGALYHLFYAALPKSGDVVPLERHLLFVVINLGAMGLMIWNHRKALLLLVPLIFQQLYSHGLFLYTEWRDFERVDWPSVIVLVTMPLLGFYLRSSFSKKEM